MLVMIMAYISQFSDTSDSTPVKLYTATCNSKIYNTLRDEVKTQN